MSTRGAVAWGTLDRWIGIYNHYDSYPTGLGEAVWNKLKEMGAGPLVEALSKSQTWDSFLKGGRCPYCGNLGESESVSGTLFAFDNLLEYQKTGLEGISKYSRDSFLAHSDPDRWIAYQKELRGDLWNKKAEWGSTVVGYKEETEAGLLVAYAFKATGYPDPHCMFHKHAENSPEEFLMTQETADKLFIEWVYIIDVGENLLHVLGNGEVGKQKRGLRQIGPSKSLSDAGAYAHWHLASVPLSKKKFPKIKSPYQGE